MAAVSGVRTAHATLTADTVDTVTLTGLPQRVELVHHGDDTAVVYFRTDGTDPVIAADETEVLLAGERLSIPLGDAGIVKLISSGAVSYSVIATS